MSDVKRVLADDVRTRLQAGEPILLICAYASAEKYQQAAVERAIPCSEFEQRRASLSPEAELVFY